jgi:hypothetical protein
VATVGTASLLTTRRDSARQTAIALAAVTVGTDTEHRVTAAANSLPENNPAINRHPRCQVGELDNGDRSWQGRTIYQDGDLMKVALRGLAVASDETSQQFPPSRMNLHLNRLQG